MSEKMRFKFDYTDEFKQTCIAALEPSSRHESDMRRELERGSINVSWVIHDEGRAIRDQYDDASFAVKQRLRDAYNRWENEYYLPALAVKAEEAEERDADERASLLSDVWYLRSLVTGSGYAALKRIEDYLRRSS